MRGLPALALGTLLLAGCGGDGGASGSPVQGRGRATLTVRWPARGRLIPASANSLAVTVLQDGQPLERRVVARPAAGSSRTETTFDLPVGEFAVTVDAYPATNATGTVQARGAGTMTVTEETPGSLAVSLASTVASLSVSGATIPVAVGGTRTLTATARDAAGAVVLLVANAGGKEPIVWTSDAAGIATVAGDTATATVTGVAAGTANVTAAFRTDDAGSVLSASAPVEAKAATFSVTATIAEKVYGYASPTIALRGLPSAKAFPYTLRLDPTVSVATPVTLTYGGAFASTTASSATIVANSASTTGSREVARLLADATATVTATSKFGTASVAVVVKPNPLASVSGATSVKGGGNVTGTVTLGLYALVAEEVALACGDPDVTLPAKATVAAPRASGGGGLGGGSYRLSKTATFTLGTKPVTEPKTVTIVATRAGVTKSFDLTITP